MKHFAAFVVAVLLAPCAFAADVTFNVTITPATQYVDNSPLAPLDIGSHYIQYSLDNGVTWGKLDDLKMPTVSKDYTLAAGTYVFRVATDLTNGIESAWTQTPPITLPVLAPKVAKAPVKIVVTVTNPK